MATYTDLEQEKLAEVNKHQQRKANALGADGTVNEEPFGLTEMLFRNDILSKTPVATTFASPDYGDYPNGVVATRRVGLRLHPLATSGKTGNNSIQTFVAISSDPASDGYDALEAVRIKQIVPPDLSIGRSNAAETSAAVRGFELALYPATNNAGVLEADTTAGPIPITADPSAVNGIGSSGYWTVDYANGIVRFSVAPLNGSTGVMNPNDVYGDIDGNYLAAASGGRITMFATFYQYTGTRGDIGGGIITIGDGTDSFGTYDGTDYDTVQTVVDSLETLGGTLFIKEGNYTYTDTVVVPEGVNIIGLSSGAKITKPSAAPAFTIVDDNVSIQGLTILVDGSTSRACIEVITSDLSDYEGIHKTVKNVRIKGNTLHTNSLAAGIGLAAGEDDSVFRNIIIEDNEFVLEEDSTVIQDLHGRADPLDPYAYFSGSLSGLFFRRNIIGGIGTATVTFADDSIKHLENIQMIDGYSCVALDIDLSTAHAVHQFDLSRNIFTGDVSIDGYLLDCSIENNDIYEKLDILGVVAETKIFNNNITNDIYFRSAIDHSIINDNIFSAKLITYASAIDLTVSCNNFSGALVFDDILSDSAICNNILSSATLYSLRFGGAVTNSNISNNKLSSKFYAAAGALIYDSSLNGNIFQSVVQFTSPIARTAFSENIAFSTFDTSTLADVSIVGNRFQEQASFGTVTDSVFSNNTFNGTSGYSLLINSTIATSVFEGNQTDGVFVVSGTITSSTINSNVFNYFSSAGISQSTVSNNSIDVGLTAWALSSSIISDNALNGIISFFSTVATTTCVGNQCAGTFDVAGAITDSAFGNNTITGAVTFLGAFTDVSIVGNQFQGTVSFRNYWTNVSLNNNSFLSTIILPYDDEASGAAVISQSVITGNIFDSGCTAPGYNYKYELLNISDNVFSGNVGIGAKIEQCVISANIMDGYLEFSAQEEDFILTFDSSSVSGNQITGVFLISGEIDKCSIDNNIFGASVEIGTDSVYGGLVRELSFIGNQVTADVDIIGSPTPINVNSNIIGGDLSVDIAAGCISNNYITGDITVDSSSLYGTISGNVAGVLDLIGTIGKFMICGNKFSLAYFRDDITSCSITGNQFKNDVSFYGSVSDSSIIGNSFDWHATFLGSMQYTTISSNTFNDNSYEVKFCDSWENVNVVGNAFCGPVILPFNDDGIGADFVVNSVISGNTFDNTCTILGYNYSYNALNISDNKFDGYVGIGAPIKNGIISDNIFSGNVAFNNEITRYSISDNIFSGAVTFRDNWDEVIVDGNCFYGNFVSPFDDESDTILITNSAITGNAFHGTFVSPGYNYAYELLNISNNIFDGYVGIGVSLNQCSISNNVFNDNVSFNSGPGDYTYPYTLSEVAIVGNTLHGTLDIVYNGPDDDTLSYGIFRSTISNNVVISNFSITCKVNNDSTGISAIKESVISNNFIQATFSVTSDGNAPTVNETVITGNNFSRSTYFTNTYPANSTLSVPFYNSIFNGNYCSLGVAFTSYSIGWAEYDNIMFCNNYSSSVSFGNPTAAIYGHQYTNCVFQGNHIFGNLTFCTDGINKFDGTMIIGNTSGGDFKIIDDPSPCTPGENHSSPPATTGDPIIALNRFDNYYGVAFTDELSLGWGTGTSGGVVGSNTKPI